MKIKGGDIVVGDVISKAGQVYLIREVSSDMFKFYVRGTQPIFISKEGITEITNRSS